MKRFNFIKERARESPTVQFSSTCQCGQLMSPQGQDGTIVMCQSCGLVFVMVVRLIEVELSELPDHKREQVSEVQKAIRARRS